MRVWSVGLLVLAGSCGVASGAPIVLDPTATLSTFDTGGFLNWGTNGRYNLGGLEVTGAGQVYIAAANNGIGNRSTSVQVILSTGLGTAAAVGAAAPIALNSRGFDLTTNPADGRLYLAGTLGATHGIHGLDPAGADRRDEF